MENQNEKTQEELVREAVEEAKAAKEAEAKTDAENAESEAQAEETAEAQNADAAEEAADGSGEAAEETEEKEGLGKRLFGKKKDKKDEKIADLTDKLTRQMAEFDNFRKRSEREKAARYELGAKDVIEKMLPIVDNFERGLGQLSEEQKEDPFVQGMEMVYKQLMTAFEGLGVKPIEAVGQEFNPDFHNAVMHIEDEELGENVVAEEFQKGYMYRDLVVRHSMVKVAN